jgi:hypothetical protein
MARRSLRPHQPVVLAMAVPPLRMPDDHEPAAEVRQHRRADVAGEGAVRRRRAVLAAEQDRAAVEPTVVQQRADRREQGRRRADAERPGPHGPALLLDQPQGERLAIGSQAVHLPVTEHERLGQGHRDFTRIPALHVAAAPL